MADLTYMIAEAHLYGTVGGETFDIYVVSGGRAGSTTPGATDPKVANNPYKTHQKAVGSTLGGPIPAGLYTMKAVHPPGSYKRVVLTPASSNDMHASNSPQKRDGFLIHGQGPTGSHGCLVPMIAADMTRLWQAVSDNDGGTLEVLNRLPPRHDDGTARA